MAIFIRDSFTCAYCEQVCYLGIGLSLDHYVARSKGGDNTPNNLITSCLNCNRKKGTKSSREWYAWLRKMRGTNTNKLSNRIGRQRLKKIGKKERRLGGKVYRLKVMLIKIQRRRKV